MQRLHAAWFQQYDILGRQTMETIERSSLNRDSRVEIWVGRAQSIFKAGQILLHDLITAICYYTFSKSLEYTTPRVSPKVYGLC